MNASNLTNFAERDYQIGCLVVLYCENQLNGLCRAIVAGGPTLGTNDARMTECGLKVVFAALAAQTPSSAPTVDSHSERTQEMGEFVRIIDAAYEYAWSLRVPFSPEMHKAYNAFEGKLRKMMDSEGIK